MSRNPESEVNDGDVLRAQTWSEYIGQSNLKTRLGVHISAAKLTGRMLPHMLLDGPPGYGKTTLAQIIAAELNDRFVFLKMSTKMDVKVLEDILKSFKGGVLFLDEIHCASRVIQHELLTLLEDGYITMRNGRRLSHSAITVIGATTEPQMLIAPLRDRFTLRPESGIAFDDYSDADMTEIIFGMADKLGLDISPEVAQGLGRATGGTPRLAKQFVYAALAMQDYGHDVTVDGVLDLLDMDADGLTRLHMLYLRSIDELGGIAGLEKLSNMTNLHLSTIKGLERLMITRGFITYGAKGRELTQAGTHKARGTSNEDGGKYRSFAA